VAVTVAVGGGVGVGLGVLVFDGLGAGEVVGVGVTTGSSVLVAVAVGAGSDADSLASGERVALGSDGERVGSRVTDRVGVGRSDPPPPLSPQPAVAREARIARTTYARRRPVVMRQT